MQRVMEKKKSEAAAIGDKKKKAIADALNYEDIDAAEGEAYRALKMSKDEKREKLATMQRDFDRLPLLRQIYHEAPNDVFEMIVSSCSGSWEKRHLNTLRLVNKRLQQVAESCATRLSNDEWGNGKKSLPVALNQRCRRIKDIDCRIRGSFSLEGCPDGLHELCISSGFLPPINLDLSPLAACTALKDMTLLRLRLVDLTPLSSMPLLKRLVLIGSSITNVSPLSQCQGLKQVNFGSIQNLEDISPLCHCPDLEHLDISSQPSQPSLIKSLSFFEKGFTKLKVLNINYLLVDDLSPLTKLQSLEGLECHSIPTATSLLPLERCYKLKTFQCSGNAKDFPNLRRCLGGMESLTVQDPISDISPLSSCMMLKTLNLHYSQVSKLSPLSSLPLLDYLSLSGCKITSLAPLSTLFSLTWLEICGCSLITTLAPLSMLTNLQYLSCSRCPLITTLAPLSTLESLKHLSCGGIDPQTSLLPLASCVELTGLQCQPLDVDLEELKERLPKLNCY